jgi:hypothetical protein
MLKPLPCVLLLLTGHCWAPDLEVCPGFPQETYRPVSQEPFWPEAQPDLYHGVPGWVIRGILFRETHSQMNPRGQVLYRDRQVGQAGELGCCQMKPATISFVARLLGEPDPGARVHQDTQLAVRFCAGYLTWLRARYGSWGQAVRRYNTGPQGDWRGAKATQYLLAVSRGGREVPIK